MSEDLKASIRGYIDSWRIMSRVYAGISAFLRGTLIIASAIVAAKVGGSKLGADATAAVGSSGKLVGDFWTAFLSVYVAAGTGIEAWLKPREKWKGFMTDCEEAEAVFMLLDNVDSSKADDIEKFRVKFQSILATHREKNVF